MESKDLIGRPRPLTGYQPPLATDWEYWALRTKGNTPDVFVPEDSRTESEIRKRYDATGTPPLFR